MRRLLLVVLTVAVTVGLAGAPASAQTKVRKDKIGDAPANVDIRSAKVQNNSRNYALTVRFQKVQKARTFVVALVVPGSLTDQVERDHVYGLFSVPISRGRYSTQLVRIASEDGSETRVRCARITSTWRRGDRGVARVVVPQRCFGSDAGRQTTLVFSGDKRAVDARTALRNGRRGDENTVDGDDIPSLITTRRG